MTASRRLPARLFLAAAATAVLAACTTPPGPVEVTRFVSPESVARLGQGAIAVETMAGSPADGLAIAPYKAAVAAELRRLGYSEATTADARQVAQVRVERYAISPEGRRSPVSVGVGGSTGTYGSGVGLGVGINLGGGPVERSGTDMTVRIVDKASGASLWEGRASFQPPRNSTLAQSEANAQTLAAALLRDFPGNNGETIQVKVSE